MRIITLLLFFVLFAGCNRARFNEFRGEKLDAGSGTLSRGRAIADKQCSTCHLTPSPESMTQPTANYMLAYMGLFLGIDASRTLDDAERMHFKMRFEMLKRSGAIPARAAMVSDEWQALRSYYLALARYPFESGEKPESLPVKPVPLGDQGVTLLKRLADGRIAVGGGVSGDLFFFNSDLTAEFSIHLDSPPVHIEERDNGHYVLTIGSILGREEDRSSLYFIAHGKRTAKRLTGDLPRSAHFLCIDANRDGRSDFLLAGFGNITGGGVYLIESRGAAYERRQLSSRQSIVRLALYATKPGEAQFFALAGGAAEGLSFMELSGSGFRERELIKYPPHLGSVWLESADIDGDGQKELLVLSGDNADAGPYNEVKGDQGLRIYSFDGNQVTQRKFESLPGALSLALVPKSGGFDIVVSRFYTDPVMKQDLTLLERQKDFTFTRRHFTLESRPTVMALLPSPDGDRLLVGAANAPLVALGEKDKLVRQYTGPVLSVPQLKLGSR